MNATADDTNGSDANEYTLELSQELTSRFLMTVGIGIPARRATCLLELSQHINRRYRRGAPKRVEEINSDLLILVRDYYHWCYDTGRPMRRFAGV